MIPKTREMIRQKMMQKIAELSRKYPYAGQRKPAGYSGQMLLSSYDL